MDEEKSGLDYAQKYVPVWLIVTVCIVDIALLSAWYLLAFHAKIMEVTSMDFIGDFPAMIGALVAFSVTVFGVRVTREGIFNKGGTPYYRKEISHLAIRYILAKDTVLKKYNSQKAYDVVCKKIKELQNADYNNNEQEARLNKLYWKYVYLLKEENLDFRKIWNNKEYSSTIYNGGSKQIEYVYKLDKYVNCHVYEAYLEEHPS